MAASLALAETLGDHAADVVASFIHRSKMRPMMWSEKVTCDTDANDIANLYDIPSVLPLPIPPLNRHNLYEESLQFAQE